MIWGIQELTCAPPLTTKTPNNLYYMPRIPYASVGKKLSIEKGPRCISLII
jgi:hypothetical protein